jgi:hypothetical protein
MKHVPGGVLASELDEYRFSHSFAKYDNSYLFGDLWQDYIIFSIFIRILLQNFKKYVCRNGPGG